MSIFPASFVRLARSMLLGLLLLTSASRAISADTRLAPATRIAVAGDGELAAAIVRARNGAARRLARASCARVLSQFSDRDGRTLRDVLAGMGLSPAEALTRIVFRNGDDAPTCRRAQIAAFTSPGSAVVFVCGKRFARFSQQGAALVIVHELLHTLGLEERPPLPGEIDSAVAGRCRR